MRTPLRGVALLSLVALTMASPAFSQSAPSPGVGWSGSARCQLSVQGPGYSDSETHTWTITGPATVEGAFRVYPATWSVTGSGSLQRTQGSQTLAAQWTINAPAMSAPIAIFVRASDGRMFMQPRHAQVRARDAVQGQQQVTIEGKPQTPVKISAEAFEWTFPVVEVPAGSTTLSGSSTPAVNGSVGLMQPGGSRATASCSWQYSQAR